MFKLIKEGELKFPEKPAVSPEAKDFITQVRLLSFQISLYLFMVFEQCLNRDRKQRLGATSDLKEIVVHPWFKDLDWELLLKK